MCVALSPCNLNFSHNAMARDLDFDKDLDKDLDRDLDFDLDRDLDLDLDCGHTLLATA